MSTPSLRTRIRNVSLVLVVLVIGLGLYALPRVYQLGTSIRETLHRNYVSIEAAQHMHDALRGLQLAERDGHARDAVADSRATFMHWMDIEDHDFTELGEPELAHDIENRGRRLFDEIAAAPPGTRHDREFDELHARLDDLIAMNQAAMWRADSRAVGLGRRLTYEFAASLLVLLVTGAALSWALGWALARPLTELAERLRGLSQRRTQVRLGPQPLAELEAVAREFNQMAEQLEQYEKLNVERLLYEKRKTEAIIESLEDGVVLIDSAGIVTHINEIAALIMDIEPADALGSPFDDLSSNSPHYRRVRDALRGLRRAAPDGPRTEVQLHVRGRDHSYVLKPIALHRAEGAALGTLLILQDVTYLRDQDRARSNLVETLSHELRTPLTSLALSAQLLQREEAQSGLQAARVFAHDSRGVRADEAAHRQPAQPRPRRAGLDLAQARAPRPRARGRRGRGALPPSGRGEARRARAPYHGSPSGQRRSGQAFVGGVKPDWQRAALYSTRWKYRSHDRMGG